MPVLVLGRIEHAQFSVLADFVGGPGGLRRQGLDLISDDREPTARFDYAAPLTESVLLGVIAARYPGKKIEWNSKEGKVTNIEEANQYVAFQNTRSF